QPDAAAETGPKAICSADGWCWNVPAPQGNQLNAAWALGAGDVWTVGEVGTILHYDGKTWTSPPRSTVETLYGVWGSATDDVWAVGANETLLHYDGTKWAAATISASTDGGAEAGAAAVDAATADAAPGPAIFAVSGTAKNDVWAAGAGGLVLHFD